MIVFDAGALIAHLDAADAHHAEAVAVMEELEELEFGASALTVAETLVRPAMNGRADEVLAAFERLHLLQFPIDAADALSIARVRAETRLRMPDAVVVQLAEAEQGEIVTSDVRLAVAARARGIGVRRLGE